MGRVFPVSGFLSQFHFFFLSKMIILNISSYDRESQSREKDWQISQNLLHLSAEQQHWTSDHSGQHTFIIVQTFVFLSLTICSCECRFMKFFDVEKLTINQISSERKWARDGMHQSLFYPWLWFYWFFDHGIPASFLAWANLEVIRLVERVAPKGNSYLNSNNVDVPEVSDRLHVGN